MRSIDRSFYKSARWRYVSSLYLDSVNRLCEKCLEEGRLTPAKLVHHKIHMNKQTVQDDSLAYGFENLQALCLNCHNTIHYGKSLPRRYQIIDGELVIDVRTSPPIDENFH